MSPPLHRRQCLDNGYLVGAEGWFPGTAWDYHWGARWPTLGCANLRCELCGSEVRHWCGYKAEPTALFDPAALFEDGPLATPGVREGTGRLYACRCRAWVAFASRSLTPSADDLRPPLPWRCGGHTDAPAILDGIDTDAPIHTWLLDILRGLEPWPWPELDAGRVPGLWLARVFALRPLLRPAIEAGVCAALRDDDPRIVAGALDFALQHPLTSVGKALPGLVRDHRQRFATPHPFTPAWTLEDPLFRAFERHLHETDGVRAQVNLEARDVAKQELLQGTRVKALLFSMAHLEPTWVAQHAAAICRMDATPRLLFTALRATPVAARVAWTELLAHRDPDEIEAAARSAFPGALYDTIAAS